jgi:hypothetical protein
MSKLSERQQAAIDAQEAWKLIYDHDGMQVYRNSVTDEFRTVGDTRKLACQLAVALSRLTQILPADEIEGATLEWYAAKFEGKCGHPRFGDRLRAYAAAVRSSGVLGELLGDSE